MRYDDGLLRLSLAAVLSLAVACGDDDGPDPTDGGVDAGETDMGSADMGSADMGDGGAGSTIAGLDADEELELTGLTGSVSAVQDERGMWHIYGETFDDVQRATGYLQARDRITQMVLIRASVNGTLGEILPSFLPESFWINSDRSERLEDLPGDALVAGETRR
ncbi:MAG: penicillin acylase family protein, partial [Myxococcota bacterium]